MNVDGVAFKKGHRYITVISDSEGRALALTDDRGTESLVGYLRTLPRHSAVGRQHTLDGHECRLYQGGPHHLPDAVSKIAFDRFHVAKQQAEVVDKTRKNEHPRLPADSRR
ncbi:transposase [Enterobacteriaceae bacterium C34A]